MNDPDHKRADKAGAGLFLYAAQAGVAAGVGLAMWRTLGDPSPTSEFAWPLAHPILSGLVVGVATFVVCALAAIVRALERRP